MLLEINEFNKDETGSIGIGMFTPPISEDYWLFRVRLTEQQAIIGFPKFGTIGIGFAVEEDWNTNLPYQLPAEEIYDHIKRNRGEIDTTRADCIRAIEMIQAAAARVPK